MKLIFLLTALAWTMTVHAQTFTNSFQRTENALIPDANPTGYFSTNIVSGLSGGIQSLTVTLNVTGGFNGDLYTYLSFGNGFAVLLNRIGKTSSNVYGYDDSGFNITLSDTAATDIHVYGGNLLTGSWQPDGRNVDPQLVVNTDARTALLSAFTSLNPNGTWTLFMADMASGYQSTLVSWGLTIVTVPEPTSWQLTTLGGGLLAAIGWWRRRSAKP